MAVVGRETEEILLGVVAGVETTALTLLLPGTFMDSREEEVPGLLGVVGMRVMVPSLVVGLLPLLWLDMAEAGRRGGPMELSWLKKLDLRRLVLPFAGEEGRCDRLSMVRSESEGRDFLVGGSSGTYSGEEELSWKPARESAREPACEEAPEADRKPSRRPRTSSLVVVVVLGVRRGCDGVGVWPGGFFKAGPGAVEPWRGGGRPLTRRPADGTREARLGRLERGAAVVGGAA